MKLTTFPVALIFVAVGIFIGVYLGRSVFSRNTISLGENPSFNFVTHLDMAVLYQDIDDDEIVDAVEFRLQGVPGSDLRWVLVDKNHDDVVDSVMMIRNDGEIPSETMAVSDSDFHGGLDTNYFRLRDYVEPEDDVTYVYRDLNRDGRIDMLTLFKELTPGWGYVIYGEGWLRYERHKEGTWREVELFNSDGELVDATFVNDRWQIEGRGDALEKNPINTDPSAETIQEERD